MKIRNKQTGDVWDIPKMRHPTVQEDDISFFAVRDGDGKLFSYPSIAELNADWEDYAPKEPLIKDEKIRKAFRAWAETLGDHGDTYKYDAERFSFNSHIADSTIEFAKTADIKCEDRQLYTLEELCGDD